MSNINNIEIKINTIDELFGSPSADPFDPASRYISGVDVIVEQLSVLSIRQRRQQQIVNSLPQPLQSSDLADKIQAAWQRYSQAKVIENQQELDKVRRKAPRVLLYSVVIMVVGLSLGTAVLNGGLLPDNFQLLLGHGLTIFAWVAMWEPAGIYLYQWLPLASNKHLYLLIGEMNVSVEYR